MIKQAKNRVNGYRFEEIIFGNPSQLMDRALNFALTKQGAPVDPVKERAFAAFNRLFSLAKTPAEQDAFRRAFSDPNFQARYPAEYQPYFQAFADEMGFTYNQAPAFNPSMDNDTYLATRKPGNNVEMQDIQRRAQQRVGQKFVDRKNEALIRQQALDRANEQLKNQQQRMEFGYHNDMKHLYNITREQYAALPDEKKTEIMQQFSKYRKQKQQEAEEKKFNDQLAAVKYTGGFYEDISDSNGLQVPIKGEDFFNAQQAWDVLEDQTRNGIMAPWTIEKQKRNGTWTDEKQQRLDAMVRARMSRYGVRPAQPRYVPPATPAATPPTTPPPAAPPSSTASSTLPTTPVKPPSGGIMSSMVREPGFDSGAKSASVSILPLLLNKNKLDLLKEYFNG